MAFGNTCHRVGSLVVKGEYVVNVANIIDASLACSSGVVFKCMIDHATYLIPGCLFAVPIELLFTTTYLQHGIEIFSDTLIGGSTLLETVCC